MGNKKLGRPTDNPKEIELKVRLDKDTARMLEECVQAWRISKAEVVRRGIHKMYEEFQQKRPS